MIDILDDYIRCSLPQWGSFETNPNLNKKVAPDGSLLPFVGNTVVFLLDDDTKERLRQIQDTLYQAAPDMLAEKLQMPTFHMTLHDLANGVPTQEGLAEYMQRTQDHAAAIISAWKQQEPLHMKATWLFNMVNTSIVLGLKPADEDSWRRLDAMYLALEEVVPLGYGLSPHITMAYFLPGIHSQEQVRRLADALRPVELDVTLHMENLVLQDFSDMNHYTTIV